MSGERPPEWFDDEAFWAELDPFLFPAQRLEAAADEIRQLLTLASPHGRDALDLCCGPGRHSIALAQSGFRVTGVDRTASLLEAARSRAREAGVEVEWVHGDMRDHLRPEAYDLAINLFSSFGYFADPDDETLVLRNVLRSLRAGGMLVLDLKPKESLAAGFCPTERTRLEDGATLIQCREIIEDWSRVHSEFILIRDGRARSFHFTLTIYSGQEIKALLRSAGFATVRLFGDLDGSEFGPGAERLIAVAVKG